MHWEEGIENISSIFIIPVKVCIYSIQPYGSISMRMKHDYTTRPLPFDEEQNIDK
jgi:hypothetical protein